MSEQHTHKASSSLKQEDFLLVVFFITLVGLFGVLIINEPVGSSRRVVAHRVSSDTMHGAAPALNGGGMQEVAQKAACSDGIDNDGDGKVDYPADEGCGSPNDSTEGYACNDGIDNDSDGKVDSVDPQCSSARDNTEDVVDTCRDGVDNDGDGKVDYPADDGCDSPMDPRED